LFGEGLGQENEEGGDEGEDLEKNVPAAKHQSRTKERRKDAVMEEKKEVHEFPTGPHKRKKKAKPGEGKSVGFVERVGGGPGKK